jgi:hypothetical protein
MIFFTVNHTQHVMSEEPTVFFKNETIDWDRSFNVLWNLQKKKKNTSYTKDDSIYKLFAGIGIFLHSL